MERYKRTPELIDGTILPAFQKFATAYQEFRNLLRLHYQLKHLGRRRTETMRIQMAKIKDALREYYGEEEESEDESEEEPEDEPHSRDDVLQMLFKKAKR